MLFEGRKPDIYNTWKEVKPLVEGFRNARHEKFSSRTWVEDEFLKYFSADGHIVYFINSTHPSGASNFIYLPDVRDELSKYELQMALIELDYGKKVADVEHEHADWISYAYTKALDDLKALSFKK
ncbi:hypothetical protein D8674_010673 [Pyrus ussuriensis x Pyrus communis]|uniref:Ribonuclease H1 N-terminal domain-containing protein n=1 Tax=Pyrus ussuriensis x Pyrus communis TaxID=2448454 RepID=A0A5N5FGN2_9ROSA|nr:hypothetical protein D8674_010673 [Pyrus ussuriensis x Pyrus communis]